MADVDINELIEKFGAEKIQEFFETVVNNTTSDKTKEIANQYLSNLPANVGEPDNIEERIKNIRVGITEHFSIHSFEPYFKGIKTIANPADVVNFDLIIVPGGADINPKIYGQQNKGSEFDEERDVKEIPIVKKAFELNKKIYAVCRGHQLVNALKGCEFVQDILCYGFIPHSYQHELEFHNKGVLYDFFQGKTIISTHHQGVFNTTLRGICYHNGICEGTESKYIITTQFHPEFEPDININKPFFDYLKRWAFIGVK